MVKIHTDSDIQKQFNELCKLIDSVNWRKTPYRGTMEKIAQANKVTVQAIYNAAKRDRNVRVMTQLANEIDTIHTALREAANVYAAV